MMLTQTTVALITAVISSAVAILVVVFRDVILDHRKETRRLRRELIDKKLTEIYSPLWVATASGVSPNFLDDETIRTRIEANFHLLSPEMQAIIHKILAVNPNNLGWVPVYFERGDDATVTIIKEADSLLLDLIDILREDMKELQQEYSLISRRAPRRSLRSRFFPRARNRSRGRTDAGGPGGIITAPEPANTRSTEPQRAAEEISWREARPAREAPRVIHLGPPAAELDRAAELAAGIAGGVADGVEKALGAALDFAADFIAPPPPPTKEQVRQRQEDTELRFGLAAWAREQAERQAGARRSQDAAEREAEDERGRQRERERDRGYERDM
jgi:hypothetical protein